MMKTKDKIVNCTSCNKGFVIRGKDLKHHCPMCGKKYLLRKTKPKAEFYEKRGR
jgi:predicted RNA-binding Zn-ribbon protein involved in translation (DUF1610 family)